MKKSKTEKSHICRDGETHSILIDGVQHELCILQDDGNNPREFWDNASTLLCWSRFNIGDKHDYCNIDEALNDICKKMGREDLIRAEWDGKTMVEELKDIVCIKWLFLYNHGGLAMRTTPFPYDWDSSCVGFAYITKQKAEEEGITDKNWYEWASNMIDGEVKDYDTFLHGEMYGFELYSIKVCEACGHSHKTLEDACWGFLGSDIFENGMLDYLPDEVREYFENGR